MKRRKDKEIKIVTDIQEVVKELHSDKKTIKNAEMIVKALKENKGVEESVKKVKDVMKKELGFSYRSTKKIPV